MKRKFILKPILIQCIAVFFGYAQNGDPLFTQLPENYTNIYFNNKIVDKRDHNILIYSNYYGGAGVGIGDFNNDGLQDIFFAGNLVSDRVYQNLGDLQFKDVTQMSGIKVDGAWSSGVIIGDVNNDGWQDIYVTRELYDGNSEIRKNKLYINTSKNNTEQKITFNEMSKAYGLDNSERTRHAAFIDYDKDGDLDVFLLNQPPNPGNFSEMYNVDLSQEKFAPRLYRNNGDQTFIDVSEKAGVLNPGFANSIAVFDANNDGWQDIYMSNDFDVADFFYLNNGDGTFQEIARECLRHISYFSMGVDVADINNDGNLDVMVVDMVAEDNYRIKSNMSGMDPKTFWKTVQKTGHYQYMFNTLQIYQGIESELPQYSDIAQFSGIASTDWSWSNIIADFDNDGYKDIYVTNGLMRDIRNTDADKAVSNYINRIVNEWIKINPNKGDVSIWDIIDLENVLDLIPSVKLSNYAYKNLNGYSFEKVSKAWGLDKKSFSTGCAYGDLDNDGDLDLIVNNVNDMAFVYRNNSNLKSENNFLRVQLSDKANNSSLIGARVEISQANNIQTYEFTSVRGMYSSSEQIAHFGLSKDSNIDSIKVIWPNQKITVLSNIKANRLIQIDFNSSKLKEFNNSTYDRTLFKSIDILKIAHRENAFNDYDKQVLLPHKMSELGPALAIGDVDGDGLEDLFMGAASGIAPSLYLQNNLGGFKKVTDKVWIEASKYEDLDALFVDIDNDGDLDLYVVSGGNEWTANSKNYRDRVYLNNGIGRFSYASGVLPEFSESGSSVRAFDFDQDGDKDLFVGGRHKPWEYPTPVSSRILKNENGIYKDVTKLIAPDLLDIGMVTDAVWLDFDQDGFTDLVLTGEWMPLTFIQNNNGEFSNTTLNSGLKNTEGWWYSLEKADMDNDGDMDLIAGNLGLNYKYKASEFEPFEIYYYDFDQNGNKDIVLSYYNFGEQFPLRGKSCSIQQVPKISQKFNSYNNFASASLMDVYGYHNLNSALNYKAKTFASSYFENKGNGKFTMTAFPKEAQFSNIDDILIFDFDNDGSKDILFVGNMYCSEIETTRNDAGIGLYLKGDGRGNFIAVSSEKSGFVIIGDAKTLKKIIVKNKLIILVVLNNNRLKSFKLNKKN